MYRLPRTFLALLFVAGCGKSPETQVAKPPDTASLDADPEPTPVTDAATAGPTVVFQTPTGAVKVAVEIAKEPREVQRGLMHRKHLEPNAGMLFLFPYEKVQSFWMKNTLIPLDMIFVNKDMFVAGIVENAQPLTTHSQSVGVPSQFVIEVNGGWSRQNGVAAGTEVAFENVP